MPSAVRRLNPLFAAAAPVFVQIAGSEKPQSAVQIARQVALILGSQLERTDVVCGTTRTYPTSLIHCPADPPGSRHRSRGRRTGVRALVSGRRYRPGPGSTRSAGPHRGHHPPFRRQRIRLRLRTGCIPETPSNCCRGRQNHSGPRGLVLPARIELPISMAVAWSR